MNAFDLLGLLLTAAALLAYANRRWLGLPTPVGVMLGAVLLSLALLFAAPETQGFATSVVRGIDFNALLMQGMLAFLLFAGALFVNLEDLVRQALAVSTLAVFGVAASTLIVGFGVWGLARWLGIDLPLIYALLFGALISPTDPVAVLGILRGAKVSRELETLVVGESLFNDGVGVVVYVALLGFLGLGGHAEVTAASIGGLFVREALGGLGLGLALGAAGFLLMRRVDDYVVEILLTLALVAGGYALAGRLEVSGPLAMVTSGLFIGNRGRLLAMSRKTRENLSVFWEVLDQILNAVLFVLIGLEMLVVPFTVSGVFLAFLAVGVVLLARFLSAGLPIAALRMFRRFPPYTVRLLTWGGLRGGISIALALGLPEGAERNLILTLTYGTVLFSVLVQGLSVSWLARRATA